MNTGIQIDALTRQSVEGPGEHPDELLSPAESRRPPTRTPLGILTASTHEGGQR